MSTTDKTQRALLDALRMRICLHDCCEAPLVLHEGELASAFGLSRTPVRQMLQTLAHEGAVETKPGVGTMATQLDPADRDCAIAIFGGLLQVAADCGCTSAVSTEAKVELAGVHNLLSVSTERSPELFVDVSRQVLSAFSSVVTDHILHDAVVAAHWRVLRWRVRDIRRDPHVQWRKFERNLAQVVEAATKGDGAHLVRGAGGLTRNYYGQGAGEAPLRAV